MVHLKYCDICDYEFQRDTSAAETALEALIMYMAVISQVKTQGVRFWFQRFHSGNFDLQNKSRGRSETH